MHVAPPPCLDSEPIILQMNLDWLIIKLPLLKVGKLFDTAI
jgi:hypothetical protein